MISHSEIESISRLSNLLQSEAGLPEIFSKLQEVKLKYGIFAGTCVSVLTGNRESTDIDLLVADDDFDLLIRTLAGRVEEKETESHKGAFFYPDQSRRLEFASKLDFIVDGIYYPIRLTERAWKNCWKYEVDGVEVILLNPVDTVLEKAIDTRGSEMGKHDPEDIEALMTGVSIDMAYLAVRAKEMKAVEKVAQTLSKYGVSLPWSEQVRLKTIPS